MAPRVREKPENFSASYKPFPDELPEKLDAKKNQFYMNKISDFLAQNCRMALGTEEQGRLYYANSPDGDFYCLEHTDLISEQGRANLVQFARGNRLFVVPAGETTPVQLQLEVNQTGFNMQFADNLDQEPERPSLIFRKLHEWFPNVKLFTSWVEPAESNYQNYKKISSSVSRVRSERAEQGFSDSDQTEVGAEEQKKHDKENREAGKQQVEFLPGYEESQAMVHRNSVCNAQIDNVYSAEPVCDARLVERKNYAEKDFENLTRFDTLPLAENADRHTVKDGLAVLQKKDFAALAVFTALTDENAGAERTDGKPLRPELRPNNFSTMFTADLAASNKADPIGRENIHQFFTNPINPAREKTEQAIREYQNGNIKPLAKMIVTGLEAYKTCFSYIPQGSSKSAAMTEQASRLVEILESSPKLQQEAKEQAKALREDAAARLQKTQEEHAAFLSQPCTKVQPENSNQKFTNQDFMDDLKSTFQGALHTVDNLSYVDRKPFTDLYAKYPESRKILETDAQLHASEVLFKSKQSFDLNAVIAQVKINRHLNEVIQDGEAAMCQLYTGILGKNATPLSPAEKADCLRKIVRADALRADMIANENELSTPISNYQMENALSGYVMENVAPPALPDSLSGIQSIVRSSANSLLYKPSNLCKSFDDRENGTKELDSFLDKHTSKQKTDSFLAKSDKELLEALKSRSSLLKAVGFDPQAAAESTASQKELTVSAKKETVLGGNGIQKPDLGARDI